MSSRIPVYAQGPLLSILGPQQPQVRRGQPGQMFKGLNQRPYTLYSPFPRLVPGSRDGSLAPPSGTAGVNGGANTSPFSSHPHIMAPCSSAASFPASGSKALTCFLADFPSPGRSGHLLGLATIPDTEAHQDQVLIGLHCNHPGLLSWRSAGAWGLGVWLAVLVLAQTLCDLGKSLHLHAPPFPHLIK